VLTDGCRSMKTFSPERAGHTGAINNLQFMTALTPDHIEIACATRDLIRPESLDSNLWMNGFGSLSRFLDLLLAFQDEHLNSSLFGYLLSDKRIVKNCLLVVKKKTKTS
jgi:hypothetical protein